MPKNPVARDWTPVSKPGGIYCSPACGFNCKKSDYEAAHANAKALAKVLEKVFPGTGRWEGRVWENWQWNYAVGRDGIEVFVHRNSGASAYFNSPRGGKQFVGHGATPLAAVQDALRQAREELRDLELRLGAFH